MSEEAELRQAYDPETSVAELVQLAMSSYLRVRCAVAVHSNTPPQTLENLAQDFEGDVRGRVAANPNTWAKTLAVLSRDFDEFVRAEVASHASTPDATLESLAHDDSPVVREKVGTNPKTGPEMLAVLGVDGQLQVRVAVAENSNTPGQVLAELATDENAYVRRLVAHNPATPPHLRRLAFFCHLVTTMFSPHGDKEWDLRTVGVSAEERLLARTLLPTVVAEDMTFHMVDRANELQEAVRVILGSDGIAMPARPSARTAAS